MKSFLQFLLFVLLITLVLAGLYAWKSGHLVAPASPNSAPAVAELPPSAPALKSSHIPGLAGLDEELGRVAEAVIPSVVSINVLKGAAVDPREALLMQYFGLGRRPPTAETGSGAIVSAQGHIVTNVHVIDNASEVSVTLSDGQRVPGKVLGVDPLTDIAILQIDVKGLKPLTFADSEKVHVGQLVFAVGAPYGLQESVTMGIISARDRLISSETSNEFFQTDAPINPGNSGGPLINIHGEIVAINNSIKTESGGSQGLAFSIPSNTVRRVLEQILQHGRVLRPYLGVVMLPLDANLAQQLGLPHSRGALIDAVFADSPAAVAGIRRGDFVIKFDGQEIRGFSDLRKRVAEAGVNQKVTLDVLREGQVVRIPVMIVEQGQPVPPATSSAPAFAPPPSGVPGPAGTALSGVAVGPLTPELIAQRRLPQNIEGVMVQSIAPGSPAQGVLQPGDAIERINDTAITSPQDYASAAGALAPGERAILLLARGRVRSFEVVGP
ncbi:MAG: trypsin-like peptidase domain-containing protein [Chthoniobacterales bacterium]|jgi:serine protease Do